MTLELVALRGDFQVTTHRVGGAAVLSFAGGLDPADPIAAGPSVEAALVTVEACLSTRPIGLIVDVSKVEISRFTVGLLSLVRRRTARMRVPLVLAGAPSAGLDLLEQTKVAGLYRIFPSVSSALEALATRPAPVAALGW